jgi:CheY-like chemotaxis protein
MSGMLEEVDPLTKQRDHVPRRWAASERIILAEDDPDVRVSVASVLELFGYSVVPVSNGRMLLRAVQSFVHSGRPPALVLTDQRMPAMSGLEVAAEIQRRRWKVPVVIMTAFGDEDLAEQARRAGITLVRKPFEVEDLLTIVGYVVDRIEVDPLACAACAGTDDLRAIDDGANVFFCRECRSRFESFDPADPGVDIGSGD